jgi:hypothetical protein
MLMAAYAGLDPVREIDWIETGDKSREPRLQEAWDLRKQGRPDHLPP